MELKSFNELKKILDDKIINTDVCNGFPIIIFGQQKQLIKESIKLIYDTVQILPELNIVTLEDAFISYDEAVNACETLPIISEIKIVHIKNPYFLKKITSDSPEGKKQLITQSDALIDYINNYIKKVPSNILLLISYDGDIDYNNKVLYNIKSHGYALEHKILRGEELNNHIVEIFEKNGKKISKSDLFYFIAALGNSFEQMDKEIEKLCIYSVDEDTITKKNIDEIVHKGMENNIFKMVDSMSIKNAETAVSILDTLLFQKETLRILGMIIRQYRILYLIYLMLEQKNSFDDIKSSLKAKKINLMDFVINNLIKQSKNYDASGLRKALTICFESDYAIKSNRYAPELVLETLIVKLCK